MFQTWGTQFSHPRASGTSKFFGFGRLGPRALLGSTAAVSGIGSSGGCVVRSSSLDINHRSENG